MPHVNMGGDLISFCFVLVSFMYHSLCHIYKVDIFLIRKRVQVSLG